MLALLHRAAAVAGKSQLVPPPAQDRQYFHAPHDDAPKRRVGPDTWDQRTWDFRAVYNQRKPKPKP